MINREFKAGKNNHLVELKITGYDEPNNGRELWIADLFIDNRPANNLFKNGWNRLKFKLEKFIFSAADESFVFIPAEGTSLLINTSTLEVHYPEAIGLSTIHYLGNCFYNRKLVIAYTHYFTVYNPDFRDLQQYQFNKHNLIRFTCDGGLFITELKSNEDNSIFKEQFLLF
jgi:hypothetical protein